MKKELFNEHADNAHMLLAGLILAGSLIFGAWLTGQWFGLRTGPGAHIGTPLFVVGELRVYDVLVFFDWLENLHQPAAIARLSDGIWIGAGFSCGLVGGWTVLRKPLVRVVPVHRDSPTTVLATPPVIVDEDFLNRREPRPTATVGRPQMKTIVDPTDGVKTVRTNDDDSGIARYAELIAEGLDGGGRDNVQWAPIHSAVTARSYEYDPIPDAAVTKRTTSTSDRSKLLEAAMKTQGIVELRSTEIDDVFDVVIDEGDINSRVTRHGFESNVSTKTPHVVAETPTLFNPLLSACIAKTPRIDDGMQADYPIRTALITEAELSEVLDRISEAEDGMFNIFDEDEA